MLSTTQFGVVSAFEIPGSGGSKLGSNKLSRYLLFFLSFALTSAIVMMGQAGRILKLQHGSLSQTYVQDAARASDEAAGQHAQEVK